MIDTEIYCKGLQHEIDDNIKKIHNSERSLNLQNTASMMKYMWELS